MSERDEIGGKSGRQPAEGVRIIKAEEARAALEAGEAAGRRPDDQLRFGDVPPAPAGPRPAHRFPLPDSVDPAEAVALPPLATPRRPSDSPERRPPLPPDSDWRVVTGDPEPGPAPTGSGPEGSGSPAAPSGSAPEPGASAPAPYDPPPPPHDLPPPPHDLPPPPPPAAQPGPTRPAAAPPVPPPPGSPRPDPSASGAAGARERRVTEANPAAAERPPSPPVSTDPPPVGADPALVTPAGFEPPAGGRSVPAAGSEDRDRDEPPNPAPPPPPGGESNQPRSSWSPQPAPEPTVQEQEPSRNMEPSWSSRPTPMFEGADDRTTEMSVPEEGITVSGGGQEMPHWTDPPTGEVPRLRFEDDLGEDGDEDLEAWKSLGSRGVRWRDEHDWNEADQLDDLAAEVEPVGALDSTRPEHSDIYSFDEEFERVTSRTGSQPVIDAGDDEFDPAEDFEPPASRRNRRASRPSRPGRRSAGRRPARVEVPGDEEKEAAAVGATRSGPRGRGRGPRRPAGPARAPGGADGAGRGPSRSRSGGDLGSRVGIGIGLVVLLAIAYAVGAKALLALSVVIVVAAAAEAYQMVRSAGFRPATLLGLVATAGCLLGAYWRGTGAIAVVSVFLIVGAMLWYILRIVEARPLANVAVTVMVFAWVAVLGSFAAVMLAQPHGKGEFLGAVVVAVVADVFAYGVGRWIGSRPLAASISPHKTVEGFIGGLIGALIAGAIIGKELAPWAGMKHGVILGLVIGLIAPVGDLFESMIKRDLGIKDSGTVLAGHGGLLDRFDGILVALPAAYFVVTFFKL